MPHPGRLLSYCVFLLTVFLSAFLLFQVQPLISKYILPWFGGTPAVWTTCMLFFQVTLFGGYLYAHLLVSKLGPKAQAGLHLTLMLGALLLLPIAPDPSWKPVDASEPIGRIVLLLAATVGLPYFVLSTTGPLLQGWFARTLPGTVPYRLYALSNIGSLLALLTYPFLVEPRWDTNSQARFWSTGFAAFTVLCIVCAFLALKSKPISAQSTEQHNAHGTPRGSLILLWIALAAVPSAMLLAVTNQVCTDIAVVPFLWVVPLALYLVTFILCFDSDRWYNRRFFGTLLFVFSGLTCLLLWDSVAHWNLIASIVLQAGIYFSLMFCGCMVCHGELVALKPEPRHLTLFYLCLSLGGAIGGLCVGLLAPAFFVTLLELPLAIIAGCLLLMAVVIRENQQLPVESRSQVGWVAMGMTTVVLGWFLWGQSKQVTDGALASTRNFYGTLRVHQLNSRDPKLNSLVMRHGQIRHGHQFIDPDRRRLPTSYYTPLGGGGIAILQHRSEAPQRVGVIGLGTGTLAVYARPNDYYRMYEINPAVVSMAKEYFTYLSECRSKVDLVVGDGRITLEQEEPQQFDVLVLDAFSGDAVPAHLLTLECGELYLKHLKDDGILACHITNRHVDLRPVCAGLATHFNLKALAVLGDKDRETSASTSVWVLLSRQQDSLQTLKLGRARQVTLGSNPVVWTDSFTNLLSVMHLKVPEYELVSRKRDLATRE